MDLEYIDFFDKEMNYLGVTTRKEVHENGLWHQTFHGWILRTENGRKYVVFQLRSTKKESFPGLLDITASGHLLSNETKEDGFRELTEELGLNISSQPTHYLGIRKTIGESIYKKNREFSHVYLIRDNTPIFNYKLQKEEVGGIVEIAVEDGLKLFSGTAKSVEARGFRIKKDNSKVYEIINVTTNNFIKRIDDYYYNIFNMAQRMC